MIRVELRVVIVACLVALTFANQKCGIANPKRSSYGFSDIVNNYIIGGRYAVAGEFPWQVGLTTYATPTTFSTCGGVIWDSKHIVTASHCIVRCENGAIKAPLYIRICVGDYNKRVADGEKCFYASYWWTHPGYNPCSSYIKNDIGMLAFKKELKFPSLTNNGYGSINTACHPQKRPYFGTGVISGWGRMNPNTHQTPDILKTLNVPIWRQQNCRRYWNVDESQVCVGGEPGQSACQGDSGGPLVSYDENKKAVLVGVTSYGPRDCSSPGVPTVYTRVSYYLDWIAEITKKSV